jgi:hypothetical protein
MIANFFTAVLSPATGCGLLFIGLAEQSAARTIDEMNPAAGLTHHGVIGAVRIAGLGVFRQPVLHIQAGAGTFEDQIGHILVSLTPAGFAVLISVNVAACRKEPRTARSGAQCQRRSFRVGSSAMTTETWRESRKPALSEIKGK